MPRWTAKIFAALKSEISLDVLAREKVTYITKWVMETSDTTMPRKRLLRNYWWKNTVCFREGDFTRNLGENLAVTTDRRNAENLWPLERSDSQKKLLQIVIPRCPYKSCCGARRVVIKRLQRSPRVGLPGRSTLPKQRWSRSTRKTCRKNTAESVKISLWALPNRASKLEVKTRSDRFANTFEACLKKEYNLLSGKIKSCWCFPNLINYLEL